MLRCIRLWPLLFVGLLACAGCGRGDNPVTHNDFNEIGLNYHTFFDQKKFGPDASELAAVSSAGVAAKLRDGTYVIIPKVNLADYIGKGTGNFVLGYENKATTQGGYVVMLDASTRRMTADELNKATKATSKQ